MISEWIQRRLPELLEEHGVVGAQVAVLADGEIVDAAAGVRNAVTKEPVTSDSLFQIGSITKVWTATLVLQLVNEGLLDLDRPVRDVLPDFKVADEQASKVITPRHLLSHTAGFEGDLRFETGSGDDMLEKFVQLLADAGQPTPPGELYSYCNSGYGVLGRIVEVLRGKPFRDVLRERLVEPLGLRVAVSRAEYADHEMADGHLQGEPVTQHLLESGVAAGSVLAMPARELLRFVRMHLETTEFDGMREKQVAHPDFGTGGWWWGLGWELSNYEGGDVIGHTGMTMGYLSVLRVVPAAGIAVAVLASGGNEAGPLFGAIFEHLLEELAGVRKRKMPEVPSDSAVDHEKVVGVYRCTALDIHITPADEGRVKVRKAGRDPVTAPLISTDEVEYVHLTDDVLIAVDKSGVLPLGDRDEHGRVRWVHWSRAAMRI
ncbi:serine hydrolase domain-containing protein [Lentzea sp. NPDC051838]|uniref:serine hydrolase domain-containing protein n=1 Tax=Lentzea sp. NPDC051838 TaxID=3154849 RepID=UPI00343FCD0F